MKLRKATQAERSAHLETTPVYPLWGFVNIKGIDLVIEDLSNEPDGFRYEVIAPVGFHFGGDGLGALLCVNQQDMRERLAHDCLEECGTDCDH